MARLRWMLGAVAVGALLVGGVGCVDVEQLRRENDHLNEVNKEQNKTILALRDTLARREKRIEMQEVEIDGLEQQVNLLEAEMQEMRKQPVKVVRDVRLLTTEERRQLRAIAEELQGTLEGNRIRLQSDFFFAVGSWELQPAAKRGLKAMSDLLAPKEYGLLVVGHTDSQPIKHLKRKGIHSNRQLSLRRALAVVEYLAEAGYPRELLLPAGWGALYPEASNETAAGRRQNRRVEILIDADLSNLYRMSAVTGVSAAGEGAGPAAVPVPRNSPSGGWGTSGVARPPQGPIEK